MKIKVDKEKRNRKIVPKARTDREENVSIKLSAASRHFNSKIMRPCRQSITASEIHLVQVPYVNLVHEERKCCLLFSNFGLVCHMVVYVYSQ